MPLARTIDESIGEIRSLLLDLVVGEEPTRRIDDADAYELGHRVDEAGSAEPDRCDIADDADPHATVVDGDRLDRSRCGAHAVADGRGLEGGPGWCSRGHEALAVADHDLAVGADVDEQAQSLVTVHPGRQGARDDVAADVGAEGGEDDRTRMRVQCHTEVDGLEAGVVAAGQDERRDAERLGVDAEEELHHRRVAGDGDLVDVGRGDRCLVADLRHQLGDRLLRKRAQAGETLGVHHRGRDAADDVSAEGLLLVEHRTHRDGCAGGDIHERGDDGGGAEIHGDGVRRARRVSGLDGDERVIDDDGGHLPVGSAHDATEGREDCRLDRELEVVDGVTQALDVGALVGEAGVVELDVALLDGRPQDDLASDTDGRSLGSRRERGYLDLEVLGRGRQTRQPPAVGDLLGRECAEVELLRGYVAGEHAHLALLARAVATARAVDRDAVPARCVEHRDARGHSDRLARGRERQGDATRLVRSRVACVDVGLGHEVAAAARARCAAIQFMPHSSLPARRSAAFVARMMLSVRESMIAEVRPHIIAMGMNTALIV